MRSRHITVEIDLEAVRSSAERIRRRTGVGLLAVIKADAYGLGASAVADALTGVADELAYFSIHEAREVGKPGLVLGPPEAEAAEYRELGLRPTVFTAADARRLADTPCMVSVDTGMQRFGCEAERVEELLACGNVTDLLTHTGRPEGAAKLRELGRATGRRLHAAASALLEYPEAWLDAVRPGVALYRGAMRVTARLVSVRTTYGPAGYTGFECPHVGLILAGYSNLLGPAPVMINGRRQRIIEAGMNSSFVSVDPRDKAGDEVVLLGDGLDEATVAAALGVREHEVLCRYGATGMRQYQGCAAGRTVSYQRAGRQS